MKGDDRVIAALNERLVEEFTGDQQYTANLGQLENWQFTKLADYVRERRDDERRHYGMILDQILFLEGIPVYGRLNLVQPGRTFQEMLVFDRISELSAILRYNETIALCVEVGDEITANILRRILADEADHINDIEARQMQIEMTGIGPFLAVQIGG
jgi:bacterioferritin